MSATLRGITSIVHSLVGINTSDSTRALSAGKGKQLENLIQQKTPVGSIGIFTQSIAPAGVLYYNGALALRADFPYLWQWAQDQGLVDNSNAAKFGTGNGVTTFRLPDWRGLGVRGSGISSTFKMANGAYYNGGALMGVLLDQMQGHRHNPLSPMTNFLGNPTFTGVGGGPQGAPNADSATTGGVAPDPAYGPQRNGAETRGVSVGIHFGVFYE